ncbi:MAG TPA: flagellar basal-body MS-ring/collar protein FliF [Acidimicrobiales bacterium]|nr:flagellar basal-body MS-ring/collar protein FliF [Acidimicrobiales bacterium]
MALVPSTELTRARDGLKRFASEFTSGQKAVTIAATIAVVVGAFAFMSFSGKPNYTPLFTNLQSSDAANIASKLTSDKVPYQLSDGGSTILVPASDVDQERLSLAQAGLPATSTVGLSLLDKEGITSSNMTQQADYLQALQGELEQTIDSISNVTSSQVNIALPANQDFALSNDSPTGASVLVTMRAGQSLTDSEVQAIVHLVGSSVPNLSSGSVTVADSNGNLLAGPGVAEGEGGNGSQTDSYDAGVQAKVEAYLAAALGQNNADVQVNATLSYDQVSTTTQSIAPGANGQPSPFCTQTSTSNQSYTGTGTPPGGTAGTITGTSGTGNGTYTNTQNTQTCEPPSQETKTVQQAPGTVVSQSVAVLVNSKAIPKGLSLTSLQTGVAAAAGINTTRGDQLAFSSMPFSTASAQQAAKAAAAGSAADKKQAMGALIKTGVVFLIIAVVMFLLWRSAKKARLAPPTQVLGPSDLAALTRSLADEPTGQLTPAMAQISNTREAGDVNRFIDSQPDDVATMLRTWLADSPQLSNS